MNKPILDVFANAAELAATAAREVERALRIALIERSQASLVATGGRSPGAVYDLLAQAELDWGRVTVTLSDERWVEPTSDDSNEKLARERLLTGAAKAATFVPLKREVDTAQDSAAASEPAIAPLTPFDVVLLGMGEDGHIASLFPGNPALTEGLDPDSGRLVLGVPKGDPAPNIDRISLTLAALKSASLILVLTSGEAKRAIITTGAGKPIHALIDAAQGRVRILWTP